MGLSEEARDVSDINVHEDGQKWKLSQTIRVTRGCHVNAEKRLLARAMLVNHANLYYGCWSAVLTLLTLVQGYGALSLPAACFASSVALWAAYASAEKYELRARDFFCSYLELQRLWAESEDVEQREMEDKDYREARKRLFSEYSDVLASTENHTEEDYLNYLYGEYVRGEGRALTTHEGGVTGYTDFGTMPSALSSMSSFQRFYSSLPGLCGFWWTGYHNATALRC